MLKKNFLLGIAVSIAVALMSGMLFILDKGSLTRKKIIKKAVAIMEAIRDRFHGLAHAGNDSFKKSELHELHKSSQRNPLI